MSRNYCITILADNGITFSGRYQDAAIELKPNDVFVAFTDGVTEALNPAGEEFGEDRLKQLMRSIVHLPAREICQRTSMALRSWIAEADQHDDLTCIVLKVL